MTLDRLRGCLLGQAIGDALGVPYEFGMAPLHRYDHPAMIGGGLGPYEPGEWSDDTQMAACITLAARKHRDLDEAFLEDVAVRFRAWADQGATDIGGHTAWVTRHRWVRKAAPGEVAPAMRAIALDTWESTGGGLSNGALMRTAAVAAACARQPLMEWAVIADTARQVAGLTHAAPLTEEVCAFWTVLLVSLIDGHALTQARDTALAYVDDRYRVVIADALALAEVREPREAVNNGHTLRALQAAWSAAWAQRHNGRLKQRFTRVVEAAVHAGGDTDTVAAIAGGLAGAWCGESGIPKPWRTASFGWPGLTGSELADLAS